MQAIDEMALESRGNAVAFHTISMTSVSIYHKEDIMFKVLKIWLRERRSHEVGLRKLTLSSCYKIGELQVRALRRLVGDVEWDGISVGLPVYISSGLLPPPPPPLYSRPRCL